MEESLNLGNNNLNLAGELRKRFDNNPRVYLLDVNKYIKRQSGTYYHCGLIKKDLGELES